MKIRLVRSRFERDRGTNFGSARIDDGGDGQAHRFTSIAGFVHDQDALVAHFGRRGAQNGWRLAHARFFAT